MEKVPVMPALVGPSDNRIPNLLANSFLRGSAEDFADRGQIHNLVRLSDRAVREYHRAAEAFTEWGTLPPMHLKPFWKGISSLEGCINATHRANLHARHIRRSIPEAEIEVLPEHLRQRLTGVRDGIEHVDEHLKGGKLQSGVSAMTLRPGRDIMEIGNKSMTYVDLADCVRNMDLAAEGIINHDWGIE